MLAVPSLMATTVAVPFVTPQSIRAAQGSVELEGTGRPILSRFSLRAWSRRPRYTLFASETCACLEFCAMTRRPASHPAASLKDTATKTRSRSHLRAEDMERNHTGKGRRRVQKPSNNLVQQKIHHSAARRESGRARRLVPLRCEFVSGFGEDLRVQVEIG